MDGAKIETSTFLKSYFARLSAETHDKMKNQNSSVGFFCCCCLALTPPLRKRLAMHTLVLNVPELLKPSYASQQPKPHEPTHYLYPTTVSTLLGSLLLFVAIGCSLIHLEPLLFIQSISKYLKFQPLLKGLKSIQKSKSRNSACIVTDW